MINIKAEIDKTKQCKMFYEIEDIFNHIEAQMSIPLVEQILTLYIAYERDEIPDGLDQESQERLTAMIQRFYEKNKQISIEPILIYFLEYQLPGKQRKYYVIEKVHEVIVQALETRLKTDPLLFAGPMRNLKRIIELLHLVIEKKLKILGYRIIRKLVQQNDQAFVIFNDSLKIFNNVLFPQAIEVIQSLNQIKLSNVDINKLLMVKEIMKIINVLVQKTANKNNYVFTTEILDNAQIVKIWRLLTKIEFNINKDLFHKFNKEEEQKVFSTFYSSMCKFGSMIIKIMSTQMKLPPSEFGKCLVFHDNLIDFINLMTNNMNLFINNYWDQMMQYSFLQRTFIHFLKFMKDVLSNLPDEPIKELFHSLSSTFLPHTLFFLMVNADLKDNASKEEQLVQQMNVWTYTQQQQDTCLQAAAIASIEFFCMKVPDCVNLICQYLKELLIYSIQEKLDVNDHQFLQHFAHTVLLSRMVIYQRIYAALALIQIVFPILKVRNMKEQMQLILETIFCAAPHLVDYPMPLIKLIFLIVAYTIRDDIFIESNKYRYSPILKLIFSQQLLKECAQVSTVIIQLLDYFGKHTLKHMMQLIIDNAMQVVENAREKEPILQLIQLNKTWRKMAIEDPKYKQINLNYYPIISAATNKFLSIVEQNYKIQQLSKDQNKKKPSRKNTTSTNPTPESANVPQQLDGVLKQIDKSLLTLIKSCCLNLQPTLDNQQLIEIEKKLMPLLRQMLDEILSPYQIQLLKIAEAIVFVKKQMTPTTSFALKNLHQQFEETKLLHRIKSMITFLAFGVDFYKMNPTFILQASNMVVALLNKAQQPNDMIQVLLMVELLHLNHYHQEIQFNIQPMIDALLALNNLDKECRLHRILAILSLSQHYQSQVYEYFHKKEHAAKKDQFLKLLYEEFSKNDNMNLEASEVKIFVICLCNIFFRYREALKMQDSDTYELICRICNALFWQKYHHDKQVYLVAKNKPSQLSPADEESEEECLSEFFLAEYKNICNECDNSGPRPQGIKYFKNISIMYKDFDEYVYFKRFLVASYQGDKDALTAVTMKEQKISKIIQMMLRCKRVRIARDANREYIRMIFTFNNMMQ